MGIKSIKQGKRKFVLSIGDEGSILTCFEGRKMIKRAFVNSPSSSEYLDMLRASPNAPIYVLVDVVDQAYIQHTLPPVSSLNVGKLVSRKLAKDFDDIDIKAAIPMGREKTGRKEWHFLFVSVRNIPPFSDWIDAISNLPNRFNGIYLLPLESVNYLKDLQRVTSVEKGIKPSGWQILVSHNRVGGFRQVVFRNNKIIFTRIAQPIGGQTADVVAGNIEQETLNTIEYIRRLGYDDSEGLDVYIVASGDVKAVLELNALPATNRMVLTPFEIAQKLALEDAAEDKDRFGDVTAAAYFITAKKHALRLGTPYTDRLNKLLAGNMLLRAAGAVAVVGMLGFTGYSFVQASSVKEEIEQLQKRQAIQRQHDEEVRASRQKFDESSENIITISKLNDTLSQYNFLPLDFIESYSKVVTDSTLAKSLKMTHKEEAGAPPLKAEMDVEFAGSKDAEIDKTLDAIEQFRTTLLSKFTDYDVTFSNLPSGDINLKAPGRGGESAAVSIKVQFAGPKPQDPNAQPGGAPYGGM